MLNGMLQVHELPCLVICCVPTMCFHYMRLMMESNVAERYLEDVISPVSIGFSTRANGLL
jgi:hypothetical protein